MPSMRQWEFILSKCLSLTGNRQGNIDSIPSLDSEAFSTHERTRLYSGSSFMREILEFGKHLYVETRSWRVAKFRRFHQALSSYIVLCYGYPSWEKSVFLFWPLWQPELRPWLLIVSLILRPTLPCLYNVW